MSILAALGGAAAITGVIYAAGGAICWSRLHGEGVQADQAIGVVPQQTILAVGARQLLLPAITALAAVIAVIWIDRRSRRLNESKDKSNQVTSPRAPFRNGSFRKTRRRVVEVVALLRGPLAPLLRPFGWYFSHVPVFLWWFLPLILVSNNPVFVTVLFCQVTISFAIGEWAREVKGTSGSLAKFGISLALVAGVSGVVLEWHNPEHLPEVRVVTSTGEAYRAAYISASEGQAYVVKNEQLTIVSNASSMTVTNPPDREPIDEPPLISRLFGLF